MEIAICDDERQICQLLQNKIERYYFSQDLPFNIHIYEDGNNLLESNLNKIDVLFLDIDMPGKNGMEIANEIRRFNKDLLIVFLTAYSEYVFESFKVDTFRYLLKPLDDQELVEVLDAALDKIQIDKDEYLNFHFQGEIYSMRYKDIIYIEGMKDKIWIHCTNETYRWRGALKNLQELLKDKGFFQVHRSYIINMDKIQRYNSKIVYLEGNKEVPISRYKLDAFKEEYIRFWSKVL